MEVPSFDDILFAAPKLNAQVALWFIHSFLWYVILDFIVTPILIKFINGMKNKTRYLNLCRETFKKTIGVDLTDEDDLISFIGNVNACTFQHAIGGSLALMSACGLAPYLPYGVVFALARHGNLSELGFETKDTLIRVYEMIFGGVVGRQKNPLTLWIFIGIHHTAAFCMVIPANLYYPENTYIHEFSGLLQLAAAVAGILQNYGYTLDITNAKDLTKMKLSVTMVFALIIWTRLVRYFWLLWVIGQIMMADGNWGILKIACVPGVSLSLFNVAMIVDATYKFIKFIPMSVTGHLEEDIVDAGTDAVTSGVVMRRANSYFGMSGSQKEWAKIRGVVRMGVFSAKDRVDTKHD